VAHRPSTTDYDHHLEESEPKALPGVPVSFRAEGYRPVTQIAQSEAVVLDVALEDSKASVEGATRSNPRVPSESPVLMAKPGSLLRAHRLIVAGRSANSADHAKSAVSDANREVRKSALSRLCVRHA
jgi:hypothetical protein